MKIIFLHMTMGLVDRGSEISTSMLSGSLAKNNQVLVLQSGPVSKSSYPAKRVYPLLSAPAPAPSSFYSKLLFRLKLDTSSRQVIDFTKTAIAEITKFAPDIIVATNGSRQVRFLKKHLPHTKIVVFGRAGIGHDDLSVLHSRPHLFIALSTHAYRWARHHCKKGTKVIYLPNPIDPGLFSKKTSIKITLPHPVLLIVGALTAYKNIPWVVATARDLAIPLLLIGDGEESDKIAQLLSTYHADFRWIKHVDPIDLPSYYRLADAFCLVPDQQESFGRVYIEAMAAGLPIVASDDTIRRDIIGDQGVFVRPWDTNALVLALRQVLHLKHKLDYTDQLASYLLPTVTTKLVEEFHALI